MRLALFSPLNPQKSGISDYAEELLPHLSTGAEIDLYVDGFKPANVELRRRFGCYDYSSDPSRLSRLSDYDAVVYQMGNDHRYHTGIYETLRAHPGVVVFHDFAFQTFFFYLAHERARRQIYLEELEACHGAQARAEAERACAQGLQPPQLAQPLAFPLNRRLAQAAEAIIVHSEWSRSRFEKIVPATPIIHINHHVLPLREDESSKPIREARPAGVVQLASFGHATPEKGIERTLRALAALPVGCAFHYTLVGEPSAFFNLPELVRAYGLKDRVTITGYVSLEEFKRRVAATDIAINLREISVGETSGSLCRIMAAGVAAIVSNVGWFSELPDDSVVKIDMDECADRLLVAYLERLIEDAPLRQRIGDNARRHVLSAHAIERSAASYLSFIEEVVRERARRRFVNGVSRELAGLGLDGRDDDFMRGVAAEVARLVPPVSAPALALAAAPLRVETTTAERAVLSVAEYLAERNGRLRKIEGVDYKRAALDYPHKLDADRRHYLLTKPFYNLADRPPKHTGDGLDAETHRHFCDFANIALKLGLPAGSRILDVGCGSGWLSEFFARLGYDLLGIDISPDLIEMARDRVRRVPYGVDSITPLRCRFETHDIESAPLAERFHAIVCYDSLHHFEDEQAVIRHLAAMLDYGGLLFILEGDRPVEGSAAEEELLDTMRQYGTLESPYSRDYLCRLLRENGFAVIGDYQSVNGLFERELMEDGRVGVDFLGVNYLLCKKVVEQGSALGVRDSRRREGLGARLTLTDQWRQSSAPGERIKLSLLIENTGDALWLVGPAALKGAVMIGLKVFDDTGHVVFESHGVPPVPLSLASGESARVTLELDAPLSPGHYEVKIDLVAQHVCWFEQSGSRPLLLPLRVQ